jgi:hypothetical protein
MSAVRAKKLSPKAKKVAKVPTKKPKAPRPRTASKSKALKKTTPPQKKCEHIYRKDAPQVLEVETGPSSGPTHVVHRSLCSFATSALIHAL